MIEIYAFLGGTLPGLDAIMLLNKGLSVAMICVLIWLIHLNRTEPHVPCWRGLSITYAGFSLSMIGVMLSRDNELISHLLPIFIFGGRAFLFIMFILHGLRFMKQNPGSFSR